MGLCAHQNPDIVSTYVSLCMYLRTYCGSFDKTIGPIWPKRIELLRRMTKILLTYVCVLKVIRKNNKTDNQLLLNCIYQTPQYRQKDSPHTYVMRCILERF
jgi:hypothetical protein